MRHVTAKVTSKRQVTWPKELTAMLGLEPGDQLLFTERDGLIEVKKATSWAERTAGSRRSTRRQRPPRPEGERTLFEEAVADEVIENMNRR